MILLFPLKLDDTKLIFFLTTCMTDTKYIRFLTPLRSDGTTHMRPRIYTWSIIQWHARSDLQFNKGSIDMFPRHTPLRQQQKQQHRRAELLYIEPLGWCSPVIPPGPRRVSYCRVIEHTDLWNLEGRAYDDCFTCWTNGQ
jgi:hypothetical protein